MWQQNEDGRKNKILSVIQMQGPSLPVRVASVTEMSPLFASAFLSELIADGKIKTSNMRVGSSPLYYLPGQEHLLQNFTVHLNQREKEAFQYLKTNQLVAEESLTPVMRVAIKEIKDFAIPLTFQANGETKTFWKFFTLSDEEAKNTISEIISPKKKEEKQIAEKIKENKIEEISGEIEEMKTVKKAPVIKKEKESEFGNTIREYLSKKDIEFLENLSEKKKEIESKISLDTRFGKQQYYLIAKDKKSVTDNDLAMALQKSQLMKMPALVVSNGDLNKKAKEYLAHWENLIKFEKIPSS